jgi:biopolymer transport protein ExbB/TolQ
VTEKIVEKKIAEQVEPAPIKTENTQSTFGVGFISVIFLMIIVTMIGFYFLNALSNKQDAQQTKIVRENERVLTLTKQITSIQAQLASTQKLLTTVDADVTSTDDVFTQKLTAFSKVNDKNLNRVHADLNQSIANVQRQLGKTRGDWLMADA